MAAAIVVGRNVLTSLVDSGIAGRDVCGHGVGQTAHLGGFCRRHDGRNDLAVGAPPAGLLKGFSNSGVPDGSGRPVAVFRPGS